MSRAEQKKSHVGGIVIPPYFDNFFSPHTSLFSCAFTLAEVLIVLAIIGIVASMTIPVIISEVQEAQFKTAYRKAYSDASNIWQSMRVNNEIEPCNGYDSICTSKNMLTFRSYMKVIKACGEEGVKGCWELSGEAGNEVVKWGGGLSLAPSKTSGSGATGFTDSSGRGWIMYNGVAWGQSIIAVDTNGFEPPNRYGKDRQAMHAALNNGTTNNFVGIPVKLLPMPDYISSPSLTCGYPPCYSTSWLYN